MVQLRNPFEDLCLPLLVFSRLGLCNNILLGEKRKQSALFEVERREELFGDVSLGTLYRRPTVGACAPFLNAEELGVVNDAVRLPAGELEHVSLALVFSLVRIPRVSHILFSWNRRLQEDLKTLHVLELLGHSVY